MTEEKEYLDEVDAAGEPTGRSFGRSKVHREGIRHRTSHVWLVRKRGGELQVLLQRRSDDKDSFPGCYDISSAGHIPAGMGFVPSALKELEEEIGVTAEADSLHLCGQRHFRYDGDFYGVPFHDNQVTNVYWMYLDREPEGFRIQKEELSEVRWFPLENLVDHVEGRGLQHCLIPEEVDLVRRTVLQSPELLP